MTVDDFKKLSVSEINEIVKDLEYFYEESPSGAGTIFKSRKSPVSRIWLTQFASTKELSGIQHMDYTLVLLALDEKMFLGTLNEFERKLLEEGGNYLVVKAGPSGMPDVF